MKLLWVKSGPLYPLNTGGRKRTHAMLAELARHHDVTYLANLPEGQKLDPAEDSAPYAQEKLWIPSREPRDGSPAWMLDLVRHLLVSTSAFVLDRYRNPELAAKLLELDASGSYDLIICDFLTPAVNFDFDRIRTPVVLFQHNVEARIWERLAAEKKNPIVRLLFRDQARRMRDAEIRLSRQCQGVIAVSPEDAADFRDDYGLANVLGAVPTGVDTRFFQPPSPRRPEPGLIGFLGSMDWMPNIECVHHFVRDIFPRILATRPDARFLVIGRDPAPSLQRLAAENDRILLTGTVDDVRPQLDRCEVLVVPLRSGGGTRIKIFEAMAQGVPVVSTTIGAEGLPVTHGESILIADEPEAFSDAVLTLLQSPETRETLARQSRELLVRSYSWESVTASFLELCLPCIHSPTAPH